MSASKFSDKGEQFARKITVTKQAPDWKPIGSYYRAASGLPRVDTKKTGLPGGAAFGPKKTVSGGYSKSFAMGAGSGPERGGGKRTVSKGGSTGNG